MRPVVHVKAAIVNLRKRDIALSREKERERERKEAIRKFVRVSVCLRRVDQFCTRWVLTLPIRIRRLRMHFPRPSLSVLLGKCGKITRARHRVVTTNYSTPEHFLS